jgi:hypothetical protein
MENQPNNKDDKYWFSAKRYGYGWGLPTKKQGWYVLIAYFLMMLLPTYLFVKAEEQDIERYVIYYLVYQFVLTAILIKVVKDHGPPPKWRWGKRDK